LRQSALNSRIIETITDQIDVIEAFNSRAPLLRGSTKADLFAEKYGLAKSAGSDAHTVSEIGNAYVEMPVFNGKDDFLQALRQGKIYGNRTNPLIHFASLWAKLRSRF
jgi:predicted metal-dependent phosphoesterase TrpH